MQMIYLFYFSLFIILPLVGLINEFAFKGMARRIISMIVILGLFGLAVFANQFSYSFEERDGRNTTWSLAQGTLEALELGQEKEAVVELRRLTNDLRPDRPASGYSDIVRVVVNNLNERGKKGVSGKTPYFNMSKEDEDTFKKAVNGIPLGASPLEVKAALGMPDYDYLIYGKSTGEFGGRRLVYYVHRWEKGLANTDHDKVVDFYFDTKARLVEVAPDNMDGIESRRGSGELTRSQ